MENNELIVKERTDLKTILDKRIQVERINEPNKDYLVVVKKYFIARIVAAIFIITALLGGLVFLNIVRNETLNRLEQKEQELVLSTEREEAQIEENAKVRTSAKAAAENLKRSAENIAELREVLISQQKDIDVLFTERNALREEVETLRAQIGENAYKDITLSDEERSLFRWILALECKGEPEAGRKAVAEVVLNRVLRRDWKGETVEAILTADGQFSTLQPLLEYWNGSREDLWAYPDKSEDEIIDYVLTHGRTILPEDYVFFATYKANGRDFIQIGNHYFSRG